jgi:CheY-like chemotaxis protein
VTTKILIVDDEYAFCKSLRDLLTRHGYQAILTTNAEQALDLIEEERPDIVTLDIRMPGMNGYEALERLKERRRPAVIVVSAIGAPELEAKIRAAGARALLRKPIDAAALLAIIEGIVADQG